jgi:hypothetical protein
VAIRERRPATVRRLFNALNYVGRRGADSTDWVDEPKEPNLLNGPWLTSRDENHDLAKVTVAGSNPVVRSSSAALFPDR